MYRIIALSALVLLACEGPTGPQGPVGQPGPGERVVHAGNTGELRWTRIVLPGFDAASPPQLQCWEVRELGLRTPSHCRFDRTPDGTWTVYIESSQPGWEYRVVLVH